VGIGLVIASLVMLALPKPKLSEADIIRMARERGMIFEDEIKALYEK